MFKAFIAEVLGTFLLIAIILFILAVGILHIGPWTIGVWLWILVFLLGPVSGAQFNPSVSLATILNKWISLKTGLFYLVAQVLGVLLAILFERYIISEQWETIGDNVFDLVSYQIIIGEILGTFALVFVILRVVEHKTYRAFLYYGFWIGFTVAFFAKIFGAYSGGAFNPAVSIAFYITEYYSASDTLIAISSQLAGGYLAYESSKFIDRRNKRNQSID